MKKIYLSIVISAWNEDENLDKHSLDRVFDYLNSADFTSQVVVVNDGSDDNTLKRLIELSKKWKQLKIVNNPHMGKAVGLVTGVENASGRYILFMDMDQATPVAEFDKFKSFLDQGYEVVVGSRSGRKGAPLYRQILAYGMVVARSLILNLPYSDTQCGFKVFERTAISRIFKILAKVHKFKPVVGGTVNPGFDVEMLYLARKFGLKTIELPVPWQYQTSIRVRFIKDALSGISELLMVRWRSLTNAYNLH